MYAQEEDRRAGELNTDPDVDRNSPASAVCYLSLQDLSDNVPSTGEGAEDPLQDDGATPGRTASPLGPGDESDNTPRSEVPSHAGSPAVWFAHSSNPNISLPSLNEPGYFSPRPLRYYHANLSKSNPTSANPSPTHSNNVSTSSISNGHFEAAPLALTAELPERPSVHRDFSSSSTATNSTARPDHALPQHDAPRDFPQFPNQAYSALQTQTHPPPYVPHSLRTRSSNPSHYSSFSAAQAASLTHQLNHDRFEPGSRTAGNSPATSPGLFRPSTPPPNAADGEGFYASPYLHYTQRQMPKETHVADVDFDPISGRKLINQYEVIDELGRGVHGKVKLGKNLDTGDYVAIKIVERFSKRRRLGKNNSHEDKIRKEIAILKKARHPNIVSLLEVIDDPTVKKVYIILEHVELGEVKWRSEGAKEIVLLEYRRCEREARGIFDDEGALIEDQRIYRAATRRRERREKRRWKELQRRQQGSTHETWSFEHGGDSDDDESENASLSRVCTATVHQPNVGQSYLDGSEFSAADSNTKDHRDRPETPSDHMSTVRMDNFTGLEGTMYGAYETEIPRGRTPSIAGSASSASLDDIDSVPEHFRYVPRMTLSAVRVALRDTILGLEYLHYQGVVHRDIKPANLLQTKDHHIKISDFGVSYLGRTRTEDPSGDASESDAPDLDESVELAKTVGTPAFYAPELCRTDEDADPLEVTQAIDVWAMGITLYCLVFGRVPFHDENTFVLMRKIAEEDVYIPRKRLKAVDEQASSRPSSHGRYSRPINSNKRAPHDLEYEEVDEQLYDLLERLLHKDPRRRLTLKAAKMHPWVLRDIVNPDAWYRETEPEKQTQGKRIQLTKEDISTAVVPLSLRDMRDRIFAGIRKIGGALVGRSASTKGRRDRARSSATPSEGLSSSTASSSSTISRDARRPSLRVEEAVFAAALRNSRDNDHPLAQSQSTSPEMNDNRLSFGAASSRSESPNVEVTETAKSPSAPHRPPPFDWAHSTMSTAASIRTIRPSDIPRAQPRLDSPLPPNGLPTTPLMLESPGGPNLGGIFGGAGRRVTNPNRGDRPLSMQLDHNRTRSIDRLVIGADDDPHAQPSIAFSDAVAEGRVDLPESLRGPPSKHSPAMSPNSPQVYPPGRPDRLHPDSATGTPSRQSSASSVSSQLDEYRPNHEDRPSTRGSGAQSSLQRDSSDERFVRAREEFVRRRILEEAQNPKPTSTHNRSPSGVNQLECPPSPDDEIYFQKRKEEEEEMLNMYRPDAHGGSLDTSPMGHQFNQKILTSSSSEDQFTSGLSQSTSNPSIPSVISANSSIAAEEAIILEPHKEVVPRASDDTLNPSVVYTARNEDLADEGADDGDDDSDNDFIEMTRPNRQSRNIGRSGNVACAEMPRRRHHRSPTSSRSGRGGSTGTERKVRSQADSPDVVSPVD